MKKGVVFNVGSGLAAYFNIDGKKVLIDCGKSDIFHPINDFLLPTAKNDEWMQINNSRYYLDLFILSHPHQDHIAGMEDFAAHFYPHRAIGAGMALQGINWAKFDTESPSTKALENMFSNHTSAYIQEDFIEGYWRIPPEIVGQVDALQAENGYQNNISEVVLLNINGTRILFPGDIQTAGMIFLLNYDITFREALARAPLDFLVAPHHGHESSFTPYFFKHLVNQKTRCLNIIPEDRERADDRHVARQYYIEDYCCGKNNLVSTNSSPANYGRKTSEGHICIDFEQAGNPQIKIINDTEDLLDYFTEDHFMRGFNGNFGW